MPPDRAPDPARALVTLEREGPVVAREPEVEQRRREQRQPAGLAGHVVRERVDQLRLDLQPRSLCRALDHAAQLAARHRPEQNLVLTR